jgi:hypothetical protein
MIGQMRRPTEADGQTTEQRSLLLRAGLPPVLPLHRGLDLDSSGGPAALLVGLKNVILSCLFDFFLFSFR